MNNLAAWLRRAALWTYSDTKKVLEYGSTKFYPCTRDLGWSEGADWVYWEGAERMVQRLSSRISSWFSVSQGLKIATLATFEHNWPDKSFRVSATLRHIFSEWWSNKILRACFSNFWHRWERSYRLQRIYMRYVSDDKRDVRAKTKERGRSNLFYRFFETKSDRQKVGLLYVWHRW